MTGKKSGPLTSKFYIVELDSFLKLCSLDRARYVRPRFWSFEGHPRNLGSQRPLIPGMLGIGLQHGTSWAWKCGHACVTGTGWEREALISKFQIKPKFGLGFMDFNSDSERCLCSLHGPTKNGSNEEWCLGSSWGNLNCMLSIKVSKRLQLFAILFL